MRFTPPREITPPPTYQNEYQSFQCITLCQPSSPTEEQSFNPTADPQSPNADHVSNGSLHLQMNGNAVTDISDVPVTPVKSSAMLVLQ